MRRATCAPSADILPSLLTVQRTLQGLALRLSFRAERASLTRSVKLCSAKIRRVPPVLTTRCCHASQPMRHFQAVQTLWRSLAALCRLLKQSHVRCLAGKSGLSKTSAGKPVRQANLAVRVVLQITRPDLDLAGSMTVYFAIATFASHGTTFVPAGAKAASSA